MGTELIKQISNNNNMNLVCSLDNENSIQKKENCKKNKLKTFNEIINNQEINFDVLIDFSSPDGTMNHLEYCYKNRKNMVIGTTGLNTSQIHKIKLASKKIAIVHSANYSIGINLIHCFLENAVNIINKNTDIEIIETHHKEKKDAPSGTSLQLGKKIAKLLNWDFNKSAVFSRCGNIGPRKLKEIGFSTIRAGHEVGEHTVLIVNNEEKISITHTAFNRSTFAKGALTAAQWVNNKKSGLFNMSHILR